MKEKIVAFVKENPIPFIVMTAMALIILGSVLTKIAYGI